MIQSPANEIATPYGTFIGLSCFWIFLLIIINKVSTPPAIELDGAGGTDSAMRQAERQLIWARAAADQGAFDEALEAARNALNLADAEPNGHALAAAVRWMMICAGWRRMFDRVTPPTTRLSFRRISSSGSASPCRMARSDQTTLLRNDRTDRWSRDQLGSHGSRKAWLSPRGCSPRQSFSMRLK